MEGVNKKAFQFLSETYGF